jgi:hypothetical protein
VAGVKSVGILYAAFAIGSLAIGIGVPYLTHERGSAAVPGWQAMVNPGNLSAAHQFLAGDCLACHAPHEGVAADRCIVCHANDQALLSKQPTAFHADIGDCRGCHIEHQGVRRTPVEMDHLALVRIGVRRSASSLQGPTARRPAARSRIQPEETTLDCAACHANQDPHRTFFGQDCAACHATGAWGIPEFRHPSALSTDCMQCHQAPPSHSMEHFEMVSMRVAGVEHAFLSQCFLCHQTNAWNDIKGVGWYKHH